MTLHSHNPENALKHLLEMLNHRVFVGVFDEAGIENIHDFLVVDVDELKTISIVDEDALLISLKIVQIS